MKKSIFAVMALAAISGANAQSSVTLYGLIDEGYHVNKIDAKKDGEPQKDFTRNHSGIRANNTAESRLGLKVGEDLGGGNTASAVVEFGFNPNSDTSGISSVRQAFIALENKEFGKLSIGRQHTKTYEYLLASDGSGSTNVPGSIFYNRGIIDANLKYNQTILDRSNMVSYGIGNQYYNLYANYVQDSQSSSTRNTSNKNEFSNSSGATHGYGVAGDFNYRGAFGRASYLKGQLDGANSAALSTGYNPTSSANAQTLVASAGYDFGIFKSTYTFYQQNVKARDMGGIPATALNSAIPAIITNGNYKATYHQIGVVAPVAARVELYANYVVGNLSGNTQGDSGAISGSGNGYQLGSRYNWSKRTSLYAAYGQQQQTWNVSGRNDDKNGSYEKDVKAYTVGLKHTF